MTAICACAHSHESNGRLTVWEAGACTCLSLLIQFMFLNFQAQCAALSNSQPRLLSISAHLPLCISPLLLTNTHVFLVCVGRFNKLPPVTQITHDTPPCREIMTESPLKNQGKGVLMLLITVSLTTPLFSYTPPCVSGKGDY